MCGGADPCDAVPSERCVEWPDSKDKAFPGADPTSDVLSEVVLDVDNRHSVEFAHDTKDEEEPESPFQSRKSSIFRRTSIHGERMQQEVESILRVWTCLLRFIGSRPLSSRSWFLFNFIAYVVYTWSSVKLYIAQGFAPPIIAAIACLSTNFFTKQAALRFGPCSNTLGIYSFDAAVLEAAAVPEYKKNLKKLSHALALWSFLGFVAFDTFNVCWFLTMEKSVEDWIVIIANLVASPLMCLSAFLNTHTLFIHILALVYAIKRFQTTIKEWFAELSHFGREPDMTKLRNTLTNFVEDHDKLGSTLVEAFERDWSLYICGAEFFLLVGAVLSWYALLLKKWSAHDFLDDGFEVHRFGYIIYLTLLPTAYIFLIVGLPAFISDQCAKIPKIVQGWRSRTKRGPVSDALGDFQQQLELAGLGFHLQGILVDFKTFFRLLYLLLSLFVYSYVTLATDFQNGLFS